MGLELWNPFERWTNPCVPQAKQEWKATLAPGMRAADALKSSLGISRRRRRRHLLMMTAAKGQKMGHKAGPQPAGGGRRLLNIKKGLPFWQK
jgi:hypothetical protein